MKGKFEKDGVLVIERDGILHRQICPFAVSTRSDEVSYCAGWCPHFGELEPLLGGNGKKIKICHGKVLVFDEFVDERKALREWE